MKKTIRFKRSFSFLFIIAAVLAGCNIMFTGPSVSRTLTGNVAIKGYDTVAYFEAGKADANWRNLADKN